MAVELERQGGREDPAARARDQLGAFFLVLAFALACGAVAAARDPHGSFLQHATWWWVGWSLLMNTPGLIFAVIPWAMRSVCSIPPRKAVEDATRAFYVVVAFSIALAALDAPICFAIADLGWKGPAGMAFGYGVAPLVAAPTLLHYFNGKFAGLALLAPLAVFLNALLVEWAGGFAGVNLVR